METLEELGRKYGTDKVTKHRYHHQYETYFGPLRDRALTILEIGVYRGASLRMWADYFSKAKVVGIDNVQSFESDNPRIRIFTGKQEDPGFVCHVLDKIGVPDIVIDDAGHQYFPQQLSFCLIFPRLRDGGIYVLEDIETSYNPNFGAGKPGVRTTVDFVKDLFDSVNAGFYGGTNPHPISSIHLHRNIVFIHKTKKQLPAPIQPVAIKSESKSESKSEPKSGQKDQ